MSRALPVILCRSDQRPHSLFYTSAAYLRPKYKSQTAANGLQHVLEPSGTEDDDKKSKHQPQPKWRKSGFNLPRTPAERVAAWQASRVAGDGSTIPVSHSRPLTPKNVKLALALAPMTLLGIMKLYWDAAGFSLILYLLGKFVGGIRESVHVLALFARC